MNRLHRRAVLVSLLILLVCSHLFADRLEADYTPESDTTIASSSSFGIGSNPNSLAFHVGSISIQSISEGGFFSPNTFTGLTLTRSGFLQNPLKLKSSRAINGVTVFEAELVAKVTNNSSGESIVISETQGDKTLVSSNTYLQGFPITVDLYVRFKNNIQLQQVTGVHFQFLAGDLGAMTLKSRYSWFGIGGSTVTFPINGSTSATSLFAVNYTLGSPNFININSLDPIVYVSLAIEQTPSQASILLTQASGANKKAVGLARIILSGFQSTTPYGVSIRFTDGNGSPTSQFRLKAEGLNRYIPFNITLDNQPIYNGEPVIWDNLAYGNNNTKTLYVTGIDYATAQTSISGSYSDIIYVNITPLDTNLVGL